MLDIKTEDQEIVDKIKVEFDMDSKPDLIPKKKTKQIFKKGIQLVKLYRFLRCEKCSKYFEITEIFVKHQKTCKITPIDKLDNEISKAFVNLKNHIQQIHESSKKKCDICDKEYFSKSRFDRHMKKKHGKHQSK